MPSTIADAIKQAGASKAADAASRSPAEVEAHKAMAELSPSNLANWMTDNVPGFGAAANFLFPDPSQAAEMIKNIKR